MLKHIQIGDWILNEAEQKISSGQESHKLEPLLVSLLLKLAEKPGDVVSKEELAEQVWGLDYVSDQVMAVAIYNIRKVLGDSAKDPHYIQTVPRRGYRLLVEATPIGESNSVTAQNSNGKWLLALVAFLVIAFITYFAWPKQIISQQPEQTKTKLAVTPFRTLEPEARMYADILYLEMVNRAARQTAIELVGQDSLNLETSKSFSPADIFQLFEIDYYYSGEVFRDQSDVVASIKLFHKEDPNPVFEFRQNIPEAAFFEGLDGVIQTLLKPISNPNGKGSALTNLNPSLIKKFVQLANKHGYGPDEYLEKIENFGELTKLAPDFAPAHFGLANAYLWAHGYGFYERDEAFFQSRKHTDLGRTIDPEAPEGFILEGSLAFYFDWDFDRAEQYFYQARQAGATGADAYLNHIYLRVTQGDLKGAKDLLVEAKHREPLLPEWDLVEFRLAYWQLDAARAPQLLQKIRDQFSEATILWREYSFAVNNGDSALQNTLEQRLLASYGLEQNVIDEHKGLDRKEALHLFGKKIIQTLENTQKKGQYITPVQYAVIHAYLKNEGPMYEFLEQAILRKDAQVLFINVMPAFKPFRKDHDLFPCAKR